MIQSDNGRVLLKKLFLFGMIFGIAMAITVSLVLQSVHALFIQNRIDFGGWDDPFLLLCDFLKTMTIFILSTVWIYGILRLPKGSGKPLFLASLTHLLLASLCALLTALWFDPFTMKSGDNLALALLNIGLNLLLFLVGQGLTYIAVYCIFGITKEARKPLPANLFAMRHPLLGACAINVFLFCLPNLIFTVKDSIDIYAEYGAPVNPNEWYALLYPYAVLLIYMLVGYVLSVITCHRIRRIQK